MYIYSLGLRIIIYVFLHFYHLRRLEITLLSASQHAEHYGVVVVNSCVFLNHRNIIRMRYNREMYQMPA